MFKVGDRVRRKKEHQDALWGRGDEVMTISAIINTNLRFDGVGGTWDDWRFELVEEPAKSAVPGIPDGYRLVRVGTPEVGEYILSSCGGLQKIMSECFAKNYVVVEPVEPPAPKTKRVKLRQYMTRFSGKWSACFHREVSPGSNWIEVPGSEIEVEVPDDV